MSLQTLHTNSLGNRLLCLFICSTISASFSDLTIVNGIFPQWFRGQRWYSIMHTAQSCTWLVYVVFAYSVPVSTNPPVQCNVIAVCC